MCSIVKFFHSYGMLSATHYRGKTIMGQRTLATNSDKRFWHGRMVRETLSFLPRYHLIKRNVEELLSTGLTSSLSSRLTLNSVHVTLTGKANLGL